MDALPVTQLLRFTGKAILVIGGAFVAVLLLAVALGAFLSPVDTLVPADAIVVISGGGAERYERGMELYDAGWAPLLVFSGDAYDEDSPSNAASMARLARKRGADPRAILLEEGSATTYQNAVNSRALVPNARTIILVTSSYHQRRASLTFREAFGPGVTIVNAPAPVSFFLPWNWWLSEDGRRLFLSEYGKLLYIFFTGKHERA